MRERNLDPAMSTYKLVNRRAFARCCLCLFLRRRSKTLLLVAYEPLESARDAIQRALAPGLARGRANTSLIKRSSLGKLFNSGSMGSSSPLQNSESRLGEKRLFATSLLDYVIHLLPSRNSANYNNDYAEL